MEKVMLQTYHLEMIKILNNYSYFKHNLTHIQRRGFSLIEILIAVAIFASSIMFIIPWVQKSENEIKKKLRTLQAINKSLYSYSRIHNKAYRLVLHTADNQSSFWIESEQPLIWDTPEELSSVKTSDQKDVSSLFKKDKELSEEILLPKNIYFDWPDLEGEKLYILYHSQSLSPSMTVTIRNSSRDLWTLNFKPIVGELNIQPITK